MTSAASPSTAPYSPEWVEAELRQSSSRHPSAIRGAAWIPDPAAWRAITAWVRASPLSALRGDIPFALGCLLSSPIVFGARQEDQDALLEAVLLRWGASAWHLIDLQSIVSARTGASEFPQFRAPLLVALLHQVNAISGSWGQQLVLRVLAERPLSTDDLHRLCTINWRTCGVWRDLAQRLHAAGWPDSATSVAVDGLARMRSDVWSMPEVPVLVEMLEIFGAPRAGAALLKASTVEGVGTAAPTVPGAPASLTTGDPRPMLAVWATLSADWWAALPTSVLVEVLRHPVGALRVLAIQRVGDRANAPEVLASGPGTGERRGTPVIKASRRGGGCGGRAR